MTSFVIVRLAELTNEAVTIALGNVNTLLFILFVVLLFHQFRNKQENTSKLPLPPGPWGFPLVGHLPLLGRNPLNTFSKYRDQYGDIFSIQMGSYPAVVLNGNDTIRTALTTRMDDFAGRPKLYTTNLLSQMRGSTGLAFATYSPAWKLHRRISNSALRMFANYRNNPVEEIILEESKRLVDFFTQNNGVPFDPREETVLSAGSVIYQILFGRLSNIRQDDSYCRWVKGLKAFVEFANAGNPIDVMPWTRFIFRGRLNRFLEVTAVGHDVFLQQMKRHKESFQPDDMRDVTDAIIKASEDITDEEQKLGLTKSNINAVLADMLGAGSETVGTTLLWSFIRMATSPEVQERVHAEIDQQLGQGRPPTYEDRKKMPYVEATILEILRLGTITPLGIPHTTLNDVELKGYRIPKNTFVLVNLASTCSDAAVWDNPESFDPMRFLVDGVIDSTKAEKLLSFGAGRRRCLGEFLAKVELFQFFTSIMQRCTFKSAPGEQYDFSVNFGLTNKPKPYKIIMSPRHQ